MFKSLRRWHFDIALFLGLAIFSLAYWHSKPRPVWQKVYAGQKDRGHGQHTFLGYSADSEHFYSLPQPQGNNTMPCVVAWNTRTGQVEGETELVLPELPPAKEPEGKAPSGVMNWVVLCPDPGFVSVNQMKMRSFNRTSFFSVDGKQLGQTLDLQPTEMAGLLTAHDKNDHPLAFVLNVPKPDEGPSLLDVTTGKKVATLESPGGQAYYTYFLFPDRQHLGLVWLPAQPQRVIHGQVKMTYDIVSLQTYELVARTEIPCSYMTTLIAPVSPNTWCVSSQARKEKSTTTKMEFYRFDPVNKTILADTSNPLHGLTSEEDQILSAKPPCLVTYFKDNLNQQQASTVMNTIKSWLAKIGIERNAENIGNYRVADLATGEPLRQVSGLPKTITSLSPNAQYLVGDHGGPDNEPGFEMYVVPHHLWEKTLSWMQWLAWLLVIPWPLRYFVPPRHLQTC